MYKKIKDEIIKKYPLISKADCSFDCYRVEKGFYVVFWDEMVTRKNKIRVLNKIYKEFKTGHFPIDKFLVIIAETEDEFKDNELNYATDDLIDSSRTTGAEAVYYLIDRTNKKLYSCNKAGRILIEYQIKEIVRKIDQIVRNIIYDKGDNNYD